ncbi:transposase [Verminephrobacter eiseniae]|nr:transposase [Verminephrobacter eiseniae]MCW5292097.1 transposase [Verminephrobacter eiseniae]
MQEVRKLPCDEQWEKLSPSLPGKPSDPGATAQDNRLFLEAVLWIMRTGSPWRDLPAELGNVRRRSFHPGAIVWCSEVMIDICIRSTIWSSVFFNRIKQFRRIATRYEKLARNSLSFLNLVCTYFWQAMQRKQMSGPHDFTHRDWIGGDRQHQRH